MLRNDNPTSDQSTCPAEYAAVVTPSDTVDLTHPAGGDQATRGLYIGGAGNVAVIFAGQTTAVVLTALAVGVVHPLSVTRVLTTSTTATPIVALW